MAFYLLCNNGCGNKTSVASAAAAGAHCPNCGEPGVTVLGDSDRKTTAGFDGSGNPASGGGSAEKTHISGTTGQVAKFRSWRGPRTY